MISEMLIATVDRQTRIELRTSIEDGYEDQLLDLNIAIHDSRFVTRQMRDPSGDR